MGMRRVHLGLSWMHRGTGHLIWVTWEGEVFLVSEGVGDFSVILSGRTQRSGEFPGVRHQISMVWTHPDRLPRLPTLSSPHVPFLPLRKFPTGFLQLH